MGDEGHAEHVAGDALGLVGGSRQLDAAALAAAASVDLRLDDDDLAAETTRNLTGLRGAEGHFTARHRDAVTREDGFALVLVDFHLGRPNKLLMLTCAFSRRNSKLCDRCRHRVCVSSNPPSARRFSSASPAFFSSCI